MHLEQAMTDQTTKLLEQLKNKLIEASDEEITRLIREAREEALTEAKKMLKERMLQAILESATEEQKGDNSKDGAQSQAGGTWFQPQPSL